MATEENSWKQFSDNLGAWDEAPPPEALSRLEAMLDAPAPVAKVRRFRPSKWMLGLLLVAIPALLLWWLGNNPAQTPPPPALTSLPAPIIHEVEPDNSENSPILGIPSDSAPTVDTITLQPPSRAIALAPQPSINPIPPRSIMIRDLAALVVAPTISDQNLELRGLVGDNGVRPPITREDSLQFYTQAPFPDMDAPQQVSNRAFNSIFQQGNWSNQQAPMLQNFQNDVSYSPRGNINPENTTTISELNWILGSWKKMGPSGAAFEEWRRVDRYTLTGRGFFVVNGDTIITDRMQIREMPDGLYYIVAVDTSRQSHKYRLRHTGPGRAVFQTEQNENEYRIEFEAPNDTQLNITRNRHHGPGLGTETEKLNREGPGVDEYEEKTPPTKGGKLKKGN